MQNPWLASLLLAVTAAPLPAIAQPTPPQATVVPTAIDSLRQEIQALRALHEAQLRALEQRLLAAEARLAAPPPAVAVAANGLSAPPPAPAISLATTAPAASANAFNPAVSLILSGGYSRRTGVSAGTPAASGVWLPADAERAPRGFSLAETELVFAASVDPWWHGTVNLALHPDNVASVEEAFVQTTALGQGLSLKAGRFFSGVGYLNAQHAHTWDFVDNPLAYQVFLGTQLGDDGLQLRWLAPTEQFMELGLELGRGRGFPGSDTSRNGAGLVALTAHTGGDLGESQSWRAGLSALHTQAEAQSLVGLATDGSTSSASFSGISRVWLADAVWKWAPNGNATRTSLKLQGEWLINQRRGSLEANGTRPADYRSTQSGGYLQAVYQFMPGWRVAARGEWLNPGLAGPGGDIGLNAGTDGPYRPRKQSLMLDFNASEFSRVRLQIDNDRAVQGRSDHPISLQYQMSLGAHGAHSF